MKPPLKISNYSTIVYKTSKNIRLEDAPLFDEMLKMMAYEESLKR